MDKAELSPSMRAELERMEANQKQLKQMLDYLRQSGSIWRANVQRKHNLTEAEFFKALDDFELHCSTTAPTHGNFAQVQYHSDNWLRIRQREERKQENQGVPDYERRQRERWTNLRKALEDSIYNEDWKNERTENIRRAHEQAIRNL